VGHVVERSEDPAEALDQALRCEVLAALLRRGRADPVMAWLTRPGDLAVQDVDLAWLRAVTTVGEEVGRVLPYVVVTRAGWRDPRSGVGRTWRRLRER
jgi:hypothetical protein